MALDQDSANGRGVPKDVTDTVNKVITDLQNHNSSLAFSDVDNFWREHRNDGEWATFLDQMRKADKAAVTNPELKSMLDNFDISYSGNEKGTKGTLDIQYKDKDGSSSYHDGIKPPAKFGPIDIPPGVLPPIEPPFGPVQPGLPPYEPGVPPRNQDPGNDGSHKPRGPKHPRHGLGPQVGPGDPVTDPEQPTKPELDPSWVGFRPLKSAEN